MSRGVFVGVGCSKAYSKGEYPSSIASRWVREVEHIGTRVRDGEFGGMRSRKREGVERLAIRRSFRGGLSVYRMTA